MTLCTSILFSQSQFCETALVTQLFGNTAVQGADLVEVTQGGQWQNGVRAYSLAG